MNENDMFICNDVRIIREAALSAIELYAHAVNGEKMDRNKGKMLLNNIIHVLAWCFGRSIELRVDQEEESEVNHEDPNM